MANKDNSERIERFLREQMSPEENDAFLNDLRNDKELREEAQMMALMIKEMKEEQAKQDSELTEKVLASNKRARIVSLVRRSLSIAAMFVLVFGATLLWNRQSDTNDLFTEYYTPYTVQGDSRGGDSDVEKELAELFNQVGTADDVTPIIDKLQTIYDSIDSEYEYSLYADDITWYLALAYLKDRNLDKAKELAQPLADNGNDEAKRLIESIDSQKQ
ncbi:MAG: hypothetical protein IKQ59_05130 [Prevotella sp.]|nr:hypothetical protein [Prevotella sp.]